MKYKVDTSNLFVPDIILYMTGRDKVSVIVLNACKEIMGEKGKGLSLCTKIFLEPGFKEDQIITVILEAGSLLHIKFSYTLILRMHDDFTIEDIGNLLWKYMVRAVKNN
jgi:hypothetical protein